MALSLLSNIATQPQVLQAVKGCSAAQDKPGLHTLTQLLAVPDSTLVTKAATVLGNLGHDATLRQQVSRLSHTHRWRLSPWPSWSQSLYSPSCGHTCTVQPHQPGQHFLQAMKMVAAATCASLELSVTPTAYKFSIQSACCIFTSCILGQLTE